MSKINEITEVTIPANQLALQGEPVVVERGGECQMTYAHTAYVCTLPAGHQGVHEAWGSSLCAIWGIL